MKYNKKFTKVIAVLLVLSVLLLSGCAAKKDDNTTENTDKQTAVQATYSTKANSVKKSETVYATLDSAGAVENTIVTDWLHTDTAETYIEDKTTLNDITNVKSDVEPEYRDGQLVWNMPTTDLYYRGTTDKTLPVSISIQYFMNDVEMSAADIAGQSGKVKIVISMTNNYFEVQKIDGKDVKVYNPVVAIGGMILEESQFQNINVENGEVIGDGSKEIAMLVGLPGLNETLGLDKLNIEGIDEVKFNDTFTITADVNDFTLDNMYFAALPLSSLNSNIALPNSVEELKTSLKQIKELENAIKTIDPNGMLTTLMKDPSQLNGLVTMVDDAVALYNDNQALLQLLPKYMTQENLDTITNLTNSTDKSSLKEFLTLLADPNVQKFIKIMPGAASELSDLAPIMQELSQDMEKPEVQAAINNLPETMEKINALETSLQDNQQLIDGLSTLLTQENMDILSSALENADSAEFVNKLEKYGVIMDNSDALVERVNAMLKYSKQYGIFTDSAEGMETSTLFVMKTAPVEKPVVVEETTQVKEENWFQKLFD